MDDNQRFKGTYIYPYINYISKFDLQKKNVRGGKNYRY